MPTANCTRNCWIAAAVLGLLVWIFTAIGTVRWFEGVFLGLVATGVAGVFLKWLLCGGVAAMDGAAWQPDATGAAAPRQDRAPQPRPVALPDVPTPFPGAAEKGDHAHPVAPSGHAQAPSGNGGGSGSERNDIYGGAASSAAAGPVATAARPGPTGGKADDLKEIRGVGPKLAELLREHGVTSFAQIAGWNDADIDRHAELIGRMGGRIRSDDWVGQARSLAADGETALSERVGEGGVH